MKRADGQDGRVMKERFKDGKDVKRVDGQDGRVTKERFKDGKGWEKIGSGVFTVWPLES